MASSTSSSSTLSPLAAPFTVDRPNPTHRLHPYSYSPPPLFNDQDPSPPEFDTKEAMPAVSLSNCSSWVDPSIHYNVSPFQKGSGTESFMKYDGTYGALHRIHDSSSRPLHAGSDSSARGIDSHQDTYEAKPKDSHNYELSYFHLPDPISVMDECTTYDRYMSQLVSCSANPVGQLYYPTTCQSPLQVLTPTILGNGDLMYNVDDNYVDHMMNKKKEPFLNQYSEAKQSYVKGNITDNNMEGINGCVDTLIIPEGSSFRNEAANVNSVDYSAGLKYGLRTEQIKIPDLNASSSRSNSFTQASPEPVDQPSPVVDSPCWKGANLARQYSFGGGEMIDHYPLVKELEGSNDLDHGSTSARYLRALPYQEERGGLICHGGVRGTSSFSGDFSQNNSLNGTDKKPQYINAKGSDFIEDGDEEKRHFARIVGEESNEAAKIPGKDAEGTNKNVKQLGQGSTAVSNSPLIGDSLSNYYLHYNSQALNTGISGGLLDQAVKPIDLVVPSTKYPTSGVDVLKLVKAMHGLSEVLLSSCYSGVVELEDSDHELARQVIGNLETFLDKNQKMSDSKSNDYVEKHNTNFHSVCSCMKSDSCDIRNSNAIAQASEEVLKERPFEIKEENFQAVLYKKLWMQAEASLCSMKYELQLALRKLEMKGESIEENPIEEKSIKGDAVEASTMARLGVLKARNDRSNNSNIEDQPKCFNTENTLKELQERLADLGFVESGILQTSYEEGCRDAECSSVNAIPAGVQDVAPNFGENSAYACGGGPFSQPFMPSSSMGSQRNSLWFVLG